MHPRPDIVFVLPRRRLLDFLWITYYVSLVQQNVSSWRFGSPISKVHLVNQILNEFSWVRQVNEILKLYTSQNCEIPIYFAITHYLVALARDRQRRCANKVLQGILTNQGKYLQFHLVMTSFYLASLYLHRSFAFILSHRGCFRQKPIRNRT